ncbi:hypothetical protein DXG03_007966 [Asterophora parasitica]|uniref:Probable threonine--tRNA ligase, cytoplasmic n=1 Tax=Asterophora parasitica TaxID=117018 RepID=A0A9P7GCT5_9AGAR|nr:hypothetical protein DXG03_007966 [Asterophora parasitica]
MGNVHSGSTLTRTTGALDSFVAELGGDIIYEKSLGSARFLKSVKCRHRNGYIVIKVFIKPDPGLSLRTYHRRLKMDRESLTDIANVYNYQAFVETDKAGYIIRQWVGSNLYDRISTRPFLSMVEKRWIAFQLLNALRDARNRKVSHGDIKSENILVTSWNWVYLSDFASYKPTYLPLDDPSDFSFFFDTSGRRTCYIAPERFYTASTNPDISAKKSKIAMEKGEGKRDGKVTEAMDCFSAGCVIAELFLEGAPLFTLSQLYKYRAGEFNVDAHLGSIDDEGVRTLIKQMINLDPSARPTFDALLHSMRATVFPEPFYSFLHNYVSSINDLSSTPTFSTPSPPTAASATPSIIATPASGSTLRPGSSLGHAPTPESTPEGLPNEADQRMEKLWADYESVEPYLVPDTTEESSPTNVKVEYPSTSTTVSKPFQDILPVELYIPNRESQLQNAHRGRRAALEDSSALIILALVTANIRNCSLPTSKIRALDVFLALSSNLTDEAKLDRMIPYIIDLIHDDAAIVRSAALRTLMQVLMSVIVITPSNAAIFPEYIIPNIKHVPQDPEVSVRCTYAQCIAQLADTAVRYLEMGQALKAHGTFKLGVDTQEYDQSHFEVSYDASMLDLQNSIQEHLSALLMDPSSIVKRAVLHDISSLCIFLGRQKTNDVLLSHMITYLNDRDWLLRLEEYILPLMIQALSDVEETVVAKVLATLTSLCELGLFQKMRIWELMSATLGFLYHPNMWIRQGAAAFLASAAHHLPPSDVWCILYPSLRHFLKSDVAAIDKNSLLVAMKPPLPRQILDAAVQWAIKADKASFWRGPRRNTAKVESPRESVISVRKTGSSTITRNKSEEDEAHLHKLQQLGMTSTEESKLLAMRDYVLKLANAASSFASRLSSEPEMGKSLRVVGDVELQKLGVVPQTVFLRTRTGSSRYNSSSRRYDLTGRIPIMSPHRLLSVDHSSGGAPFEDLRRRLATINGSVSSIGLGPPPSSRSNFSPVAATHSTPTALNIAGLPTTTERSGSPTESILSTANSQTFRPTSRLQIGSTDGQKAAPAVGSSRANATGLLDTHSKIRSEDSPDLSGRSSPVSVSNTLRLQRPRIPSLLPISTYDGQEPGISNLLENLYLDNNRELQQDFGPKVHDGPVRRRNAARHSFVHRDGKVRRTEASLIAHLASHSDAVTGIAVSPDHMFFVTASDDKTVKVWDTARLERNVTSKPRHTYGQHHARVKSVCILEGVHCFASAADDGSLHIVRVHITQSGALPKYSKLQVIREHRVDTVGEYITCMTHYNTDTSSNLIYATTHSNITVLDLRTMRVFQTMENPRHFGPITCLCIDRKRSWIVVGTSTGVLTLWDRRFGLMLRSWHVGVASIGRSVRIHQCVVHPSKGKGKWVMVSMESSRRSTDRPYTNLIEVWDIEKAVLMETFMTRKGSSAEPVSEPHELVGVDADANPAAVIAALVRSRQTGGDPSDKVPRLSSRSTSMDSNVLTTPVPDVRAFVAGLDFGGHSASHRSDLSGELGSDNPSTMRSAWRGFMITGSEDRKLRLWDLGKLERTVTLSGLELDTERPSYQAFSTGTASTYVETWPLTASGAQTRFLAMAHPVASSSHPAQISALESPHATLRDDKKVDQKQKDKKAKLVEGSGYPLELQPKPAFFDHRIKIFDELKAEYDEWVKAQPRDEVIITLRDGSERKGKSWETSPMDVAKEVLKSFSERLIIAKKVFWHSSAHVLGEAAERHYGCHLCLGPPTEDGFFYEMGIEDRPVSNTDYPALEKVSESAIKEKQKFERLVVSKEKLLEMFNYNKYKQYLIESKIPDGTSTTVYRCGPMIDLCVGPHIPHTGKIKAFMITKNSASYFLGDPTKESLQRIYGISFPDKKQLAEYKVFLAEAAKRDHRKIGKEQELFFFHDLSPGSCFFLPHGTRIYNSLVDLMRSEYFKRGYQEVISPNMYNSKLWETSGHWQNYKDDMFILDIEKEKWALKPMNCPGHCLIFDARDRSYKELPIRMAEFGIIHRNEASGALTGLTRVRRFVQDDTHVFCMPSQLEDEIGYLFDFMEHVYGLFGFEFRLELSTRPDNYLGTIETWNEAEAAPLEKHHPGKWDLNPGDGAFYGPKIDITIRDALRRSFQCATIQLDFQLPERFNLKYRAAEDTNDPGRAPSRPVIIHRAILGSLERFIAIITEHFGGKWPFWISPRQVLVIPVANPYKEYASEIASRLNELGLYADVDNGENTLQKKIRNGEIAQYNFILVVGQEELDARSVNVRNRDDVGSKARAQTVPLEEVAQKLVALKKSRSLENKLV